MCTPIPYEQHAETLSKDAPKHFIRATKITFRNIGDVPVSVNDALLLPGDVEKVDIDAPHYIESHFRIRFSTAAVPVNGSLRVSAGKFLLIQTMRPKSGMKP